MTCNPAFVLREIHGKSFLIPAKRNDIGNDPIHLNDVAVVIWKNADGCESPEQLLSVICDLYGLKPESAEQDAVRQFIEQLIQMTLIIHDRGIS